LTRATYCGAAGISKLFRSVRRKTYPVYAGAGLSVIREGSPVCSPCPLVETALLSVVCRFKSSPPWLSGVQLRTVLWQCLCQQAEPTRPQVFHQKVRIVNCANCPLSPRYNTSVVGRHVSF